METNRAQSLLRRTVVGYLPINLVQAAVSIGSVVVFTRLLSTAEYGRYSLLLATALLLQAASFYWLLSAAGRFQVTARAQGWGGRNTATVLALTVAMVGLVGLAALAIHPFVGIRAAAYWATVAAVVGRALLCISLELHRANGAIGRYSLLEGLQLVLTLGVGVLLIQNGTLAEAAPMLAMAGANLLLAVFDLRALATAPDRQRPDMAHARTLARYGLPLSVSFLLALGLASLDRYLIAWQLGDDAVGIYAVAFGLADRPIAILFSWLSMAATPVAMTALERDGEAAAAAVLRKNLETILFLGLPATVGLMAVARPMTSVLAGSAFVEPVSAILPALGVACFLRGLMSHYGAHVFLLRQRTAILAVTTALALALNLGLNLLLIPRFGLWGAITANIAAHGASFVVRLIVGRRYLHVPLPWNTLARTGLACLAMAGGLALLPARDDVGGLVLSILLGGALYAAAALAVDAAGCRAMLQRLRPAG